MISATPYQNASTGEDPEMQEFLPRKEEEEVSAKSESSFLQRIMLSIDEHSNVKVLMRSWQPRLELIIRLMIVTTFLDDSLHTLFDLPEHLAKVNTFVLIVGIMAQVLGSICIIGSLYIDWSTKALITWVLAQPLLYKQVSNSDLMTESCSLIGGLLLLRSHMVQDSWAPRIQFLGRLLLPTMYLYEAGLYLSEAEVIDQTNSVMVFISNLSLFMIYIVTIFSLVAGASLIAVGLKSRLVALLLSFFSLGFTCYNHPFWTYIYRENGEWRYKRGMPLPTFAVTKNMSEYNVDPSLIYELHRYYFFLGISTTAGLLLLTVTGPGDVAVQKDETLLPRVGRAQD